MKARPFTLDKATAPGVVVTTCHYEIYVLQVHVHTGQMSNVLGQHAYERPTPKVSPPAL